MGAVIIPNIPGMRPEPKRDRWGRYILPEITGTGEKVYTRQTTIAHTLDDTHALTEWKRRMVLQGAATRPDLLRTVPDLVRTIETAGHWREERDAKQALNALCDDAARAAGAEDGSRAGTALHTITEYADAGRLNEIAHLIPDGMLDDLAAYLVTMRDAGIEAPPEYIERIMINPAIDSAGTADRILRLPDGRLVIGDLKTQQSVDFGWLSIAIQLAGYAYADAMLDPATGELVPLPSDLDRTVGIVMHLPVGSATCTLYELDLEAGWEAARLAFDVRAFRSKSKNMGRRYEYASRTNNNVYALAATVAKSATDNRGVAVKTAELNAAPLAASTAYAEARERTLYLIHNAAHVDSLTALWRELSDVGLWDDELTREAAARRTYLESLSTHSV